MIKKVISIIFCFLLSANLFAQVGINTDQPKATLDVVAGSTGPLTAEGIIAPNLTRTQLISKDNSYTQDQKGAFVYVDSVGAETLTAKTAKVLSPGYYYFDGNIWQKLSYNVEQIYLPSFNLPLPSVSETVRTFDLYNEVYKKQLSKTGNPSFVSSNPLLEVIPDLFGVNQIDYVVTHYDDAVIKDVSVNAAGVLSYKVVSTNPSNTSFINIVLVVK